MKIIISAEIPNTIIFQGNFPLGLGEGFLVVTFVERWVVNGVIEVGKIVVGL